VRHVTIATRRHVANTNEPTSAVKGSEFLQAAVERLEGGKTFDPKMDASDRVSRIFQDPTGQSFARIQRELRRTTFA
jgi:hypothetical protein